MLSVNLQGVCLISKAVSCTLLPLLQSFPSKGVPICAFCLICNNIKLYQIPSNLHESERDDEILKVLMLLCYSGIDHVLVVIFSSSLELWVTHAVLCCVSLLL